MKNHILTLAAIFLASAFQGFAAGAVSTHSMTAGSEGSVTVQSEKSTKSSKPAKKATSSRVSGKQSMKNTFETPDFAFPVNVEKNARNALEASIGRKDYVMALRAAVQITVADGLVSESNFEKCVRVFDDLARTMPAPYSNLADLLAARLYANFYSSRRWEYDSRTLPADSLPSDPRAWDKAMYARTVRNYIGRSVADLSPASEMPVSGIAALLKDTKDAEKTGLTVGDFIRLQAADVMARFSGNDASDVIPFGPASSSSAKGGNSADALSPVALIDAAIASHPGDSGIPAAAMLSVIKCNYINGETQNRFVDDCMKRFGDSPYCVPFIQMRVGRSGYVPGKTDSNKMRRDDLALLDSYIARFPEAPGIATLRNLRLDMLDVDVSFSYPDMASTGSDFDLKVTAENIYSLYALLYRIPGKSPKESVKADDAVRKGRLVKAIPLSLSGTSPDCSRDTVSVSVDEPGIYVILPSRSADASGLIKTGSKWQPSCETMAVSGIYAFRTTDSYDNDRIFTVDARSGAPVAGVSVEFFKDKGDRKISIGRFTTDHTGSVAVPDKASPLSYTAVKGNDFFSSSFYNFRRSRQKSRQVLEGEILTDLALLHPGDKVAFSGIFYLKKDRMLKQASERKVRFILRDANYKDVDSLFVTTDRYGRADASFTIPETGLLGAYSIQAQDGNDNICSETIEVAEYKAPTFYVETDGVSGMVETGATVTVRGRAMTYAGLPVANATVNYRVTYRPPYCRFFASASEGTYGDTVSTDADGRFEVALETAGLRGTPYEKGSFIITVTATDASGETRQASPVFFSTVSQFSIRPELPKQYDMSRKADDGFKVTVNDASAMPVVRTVYYRIQKAEAVSAAPYVLSGDFQSPKFVPDMAKLPSGKYRLEFSLTPDFKDTETSAVATAEMILFRDGDSRPPVESQLWLPGKRYVVGAGEKKVAVKVGSSYPDGNILCLTGTSDSPAEYRWIRVAEGFAYPDFKAPGVSEKRFITFFSARDLECSEQTVEIVPEALVEKVEISTETFRDKIEPGAQETWKFRFTLGGRPMADAPVMAVMSDKALNSIVPFRWQFDPFGELYWPWTGDVDWRQPYPCTVSVSITSPRVKGPGAGVTVPVWNTYGYRLFDSGFMIRGRKQMRSAGANVLASADGVIAEDAVENDEVAMVEAPLGAAMPSVAEAKQSKTSANNYEEAEEAMDAGSGMTEKSIPLRESECPLAFFMPALVTDADGIVAVDFSAPQFVGTWQFQIAGYSKDMRGSVSVLDVVSSKKVMAKLNAPRFLRVGDKASIAATLYNNSDEILPVAGKIEIFNPLNGEVVASREYGAEALPASGSRTVMLDYDVDRPVSELGIRVYAYGSGSSDGEQTVIPVYPSSTPVLESTTFYLGNGSVTESIRIPKYGKDTRMMLQYCANPVWECVTALPDILTPTSMNTLSRLYALYGNAVASGLCRKYPEVTDGIRLMAERNGVDSTLVSNLEKNDRLKSVALSNTPWVNGAESETLRMQRLIEYTDSEKADKACSSIFDMLEKSQKPDGGWSWCPDMKSSVYITSRAALTFSMLKSMGFLPSQGEKMAKKAISYIDAELTKEWIESGAKSGKRWFSVSGLLNYLYVKSAFPGIGNSGGFGALDREAMKAIKNSWKDFSIYDKATAATLLARRGDTRLASAILESLRQYASVSKEKGMWFDNLDASAMGWNRLITTAQVLEAFAEIAPADPAVDLLRQWLLVTRQTEDWGDDRNTVEVIYALLTSGSDWISSAGLPEITLGGVRLVPDKAAALTGAFTMSVDAADAAGKSLTIAKTTESPSWGGIIAQFVAPIRDVKAADVLQLSITKRIFPLSADGTARSGEIHVGDKVRVSLTVTCDRDLDYVAILDARAACLETSAQLSGYRESDGVWFYQENRNATTNLFVPFLGKGTHVISYDCYADRAGEYSLGIASAQSQYAPTVAAHSAGEIINVLPSPDRK